MQGAPYPAFSKEAQTKMQREESFGNRIKTKLEERYGKTERIRGNLEMDERKQN